MVYMTHVPDGAGTIFDWLENIHAVVPSGELWNQQLDTRASRLELQLQLARLPSSLPADYHHFIADTNGQNLDCVFEVWAKDIGRVEFWDIETVLAHERLDDIGLRDALGAGHVAIGTVGGDGLLLLSVGDDDSVVGSLHYGNYKQLKEGFLPFLRTIELREPLTDVALEAAGSGLGSIRDVFNHHSRLTVDRRWLKQLLDKLQHFETRSEEHINFLGSNLVGVYIPTWLPTDDEEWIDDILRISDWDTLTEHYHDLPDVNPSFEVTGRPINASYTYVMYRIHTSDLSAREKDLGLMATAKLLYYRHLGSVLHNWFKYRAQESIALSLYESLSRKSGLKRHGSWGKLIEYLATNLTCPKCVHRETFLTCSPDPKVLYSVSSVKTQVNQLVKELGLAYHELREQDQRILSDSRFVKGADGDLELRDNINDQRAMEDSVTRALADPMDFIRDELIDFTLKAVNTADERHLTTVLDYMVTHRNDTRHGDVSAVVSRMVHFIYTVRRTEGSEAAQVVPLTVRVRNLFRSSQLTNVDMLAIRDELTIIVDRALDRRPDAVKASTRIAAAVYVLLRALAYQRY